MSTNMDEARQHVAEARRCHDKDISLGGCLSSMISAFEIVVETLIALPDARAVAEDVYAERMTPGQWGTTGIGDTMHVESAEPATGDDLAARIAPVTTPDLVMVDLATTSKLVEIARDAGQAIADLEQRLATVSENQDTAERERDAALTSLEAMERRVGEAVRHLRDEGKGHVSHPLRVERALAALTPDAGEGK